MIDVALVATIIGILSNSVGLVDKVTDTYLKFRGKQSPVDKEHRAKIVAGGDGKSLVRLKHGQEVQRVTYEELTNKLSESDLSYVRALESSMNTHKDIWESAYPSLASEVNPVAKAKIQKQLDAVLTDMEDDLKPVDLFWWSKIFREVGDIANYSEKTVDRLRLMLYKK